MVDEREEGGGKPTAEQEQKAAEFDPRAQQTGQTRDGDGAITPQLGGQQPQPDTPGQTSPASPLAPPQPGQPTPGLVYGEEVGSRNFVTTGETAPSVESGKTTSVETPTVVTSTPTGAGQKSD